MLFVEILVQKSHSRLLVVSCGSGVHNILHIGVHNILTNRVRVAIPDAQNFY